MEKRLKLIFLAYYCIFVVLTLRFFYWQVIRHNDLKASANFQYQGVQQQYGDRGLIYTKDGFPLVLNETSYSLIADPKILKVIKDDLEQQLKVAIGKDLKINNFNKDSRWELLTSRLNEDQKEAVKKLSIDGLYFEQVNIRSYPEASLAAFMTGFVGKDDLGKQKGYFGLEGFYDRELKARNIQTAYLKDAAFRPIEVSNNDSGFGLAGQSLVTNIDRSLQYVLENRLKEGIEKYQAKSGWAIVIDPQDGGIIAMAAWPNYDQRQYWTYDSVAYQNPLVSSSFEPGSIFKILIMAAGLDSGKITPSTICDQCSGPKQVGEYFINTWNDKYYPDSSLSDILIHSDNVGMTFIGDKLGISDFLKYYKNLGFNKKTGVDLEGEITPQIRDDSEWRPIDLATASFGQGIAVSPIQMIVAVNAIANGGILKPPYIVRDILEGEKRYSHVNKEGKRVFKTSTTRLVTEMMIKAVDFGEAKWAKPKNYTIAGKTGTAQIPLAGHYDPERTVASFVGFAPADNPKFTMLISLVEPKTSPWGSETAAPLWFKIAADIFRIWKIPETVK